MESKNHILQDVKRTISRFGMIDPGDRVIVAVSGGPDSVCLLSLLHVLRAHLQIGLVVAHYDHGLRPDEDEGETQFVLRLADSMNLPFETEKAHGLNRDDAASNEEKAREARYSFLEKIMDKMQAQKIAVGHNLNDQAETVIMRLLRGSGPSGLAGIPPFRERKIIRPLIEVKREQILSYLKSKKLSYMLDSSNLETKYLRNEIRLNLMPLLLTYQPRFIEHMGQMADILRNESDYLEQQAEDWVKREAELRSNGDVVIPISPFISSPQPLRNRITRQLLKQVKKNLRRIDRGHILDIYEMAQGPKPQSTLTLPGGIGVKKTYDKLLFSSGLEEKAGPFSYRLNGPGTTYIREIGRSISLNELENGGTLTREESPSISYFDAEKLTFPLILRNFKPGDRFVPLGMKGHKKVKDFFVDLKIPTETRRVTPLLLSKDMPIWICGYRIDERFKVTPETKKILRASIA
jgi:tRNA(Ile)-lysidine synthase